DTTSHWLMTGSSDVGVLSNDGVVEFDAAAPYKTLTAGTLDVNGGSFILNTKLNEGGAASETDKIVVTGDTNGNGFINVRNNGGTGAFTGTGATDGIQIVEVDGASNADFQLGSAAIVGIYDYQLKKADGQNWYLQTDGDDVVNPGEGDGGDSGTGHVVDIVPGYNIALAAAQNHVLTTIDTFHERLGELRADELQDGFHSWMRGIGKTGSYSPKSITGYNGHGFDMTTAGVQIGIDYSKGDVFIAGDKLTVGMFGEYANSSFDVRGRTADGSISSKGLGGYVTWQQKAPTERKPGTGAYVDAVIKHDWLDFGVNAKSVSGFKLQNGYKGTATTASIEAGYGFDLGNNVVLQPQAQLIYSKINADSFTDAYGIDVYGQSAESVIGRVGVRLEKTFYFGDEEETLEAAPVPAQNPKKAPKAGKGSKARTPTAVLPDAPKKKKFVKSVTTFADANAKREFKGKNGLVAAGTDIGNDMSGTRYDVGLGVVARVSENVSLFGRGSVEFGGSTNVAGKVSGGLKITW
ncbi:autotransporter outer membrane beta-barrel domain-containing protein, partial [Ochrobactrum quorumnocens]